MWSALKRTNNVVVVAAKLTIRNYSFYCSSTPIAPIYLRNCNTFTLGLFNIREVASSDFNLTRFIMAGIEGLLRNAKVADDLIAEISDKIQTMTPNPELDQLKATNEELRKEVERWKEILTCAEIRQGQDVSYYGHYVAPENADVVRPTETKAAVEGAPGPGKNNNNDKQPPKGKKNKESEPKQSQLVDSNSNIDENKRPSEEGAKQDAKAPKQPKKSQPKSEKCAPAAAPAPEVVDVSRLDFRIGKIVEVDKHPEADALYLEKIDVGEEKPRTVISGLVKHVPLEEMKDRLVVLLCNLKPAKMRGITSEAMVMCASSPDKVEILSPPPGVVPGDLVEFEGYPRNPDLPFMNPKKKIFEAVAPDLKTNESKVATYKGVPFNVPGKGVVVAASLAGVNVK